MQPILIGPLKSGVQKNLTPFMIMDEAFPDMLNAFVWRGRIQRKSGYSLLGRLRRVLASASLGVGTIVAGGAGSFPFPLFTLLGLNLTNPNAQIQPGTIANPLVIAIGAPINQILTDNAGMGTFTIAGAGPIIAAMINYSTGVLTLTFSGAAGASTATITGGYFPDLPVMGIEAYEDPSVLGTEKTIFFDTRYAYRFTTAFEELPSTLATVWTGSDKQQFWSTNFQNNALNSPFFWVTNGVPGLHAYQVTLFAGAAAGPPSTVNVTTSTANNFQLGDVVIFTNLAGAAAANNLTFGTVTVAGNPFTISNPGTGVFVNGAATGLAVGSRLITQNIAGQDGIRLYDGTTWANLNPVLNGTTVLVGALLLVPYKGRMVVLNTIEGSNTVNSNVQYPQRARWSQLGSAVDLAFGWRDDIVGRGGFEDAATEEYIVSCAFVKDELIVYFERSTWKLVYTGNEIGPFIWQRISSELGADSTFSAVNFDDGLLCLGNVGVHQCNGSLVRRIDEQVPDEVFNIHNGTDGPERTSGIRDFYQEIVYFAYASDENNAPGSPGKIFFPDRMMIYNYRNNTFSFFDDNATTFGYFQRTVGKTWAELGPGTFRWEAWNSPWNSGVLQSGFPSVNFGNQQGFVETILPFQSSNADSLFVQNIVGSTVTSPQHNLYVGQYVRITGALGVVLNNLQIPPVVTDTFRIVTVPTENTFTIDGVATGTYIGGGQMTVITQLSIPTKQFTPFWSMGKNYVLKYIDVLVDSTSAGEIQTDVYIDFDTTESMTNNSSGSALGFPILSTAPEGVNLPYYSFQKLGDQIWKRFYVDATGETFQTKFSFSDSQMRSIIINESKVVIHCMIFFFKPAGDFY